MKKITTTDLRKKDLKDIVADEPCLVFHYTTPRMLIFDINRSSAEDIEEIVARVQALLEDLNSQSDQALAQACEQIKEVLDDYNGGSSEK